MKFFFLFITIGLVFFGSCSGRGNEKYVGDGLNGDFREIADGVPTPVFERTHFDFGNLISGEKVTFSFRFENKGSAPLIVSNVTSGCGCTVADYPKDPVLPGKSGRVKVNFNSTGRSGRQVQSVQVFTNADPPQYQLTVTAEVR